MALDWFSGGESSGGLLQYCSLWIRGSFLMMLCESAQYSTDSIKNLWNGNYMIGFWNLTFMMVSTGRQDFYYLIPSIILLSVFITPHYLLMKHLSRIYAISKKKKSSTYWATLPHLWSTNVQIHFFPHFFHLFITINSMLSIIFPCVSYSSFPFKTSPVCDYSLEPEKSRRGWRGWGRGGGMDGWVVWK